MMKFARANRDLLAGALVLTVCLFLLGLIGSAGSARKLSREAAGVHVVGTQKEVYGLFLSLNLEGVRVVHLNRFFNSVAHDLRQERRSRPFPIHTYDVRPVYADATDSHNWLFTAARTGLVREITTVVSDDLFQNRVRDFERLPEFSVGKNVIAGQLYEAPVRIYPLRSFPSIDEPVVVNIDAGFFDGGVEPGDLLLTLRKRCTDVRGVVLVLSEDEPDINTEMKRKLTRFGALWTGNRAWTAQ